jgi:hypothetical protein
LTAEGCCISGTATIINSVGPMRAGQHKLTWASTFKSLWNTTRNTQRNKQDRKNSVIRRDHLKALTAVAQLHSLEGSNPRQTRSATPLFKFSMKKGKIRNHPSVLAKKMKFAE